MAGTIALGLSMLLAVVLIRLIGERAGLPSSVLLTLVGVAYGLLPGPTLELRPEVILYLVVPPLLYNAALGSSLLALRQHLRSVVSLSVVLVLVTAVAVGGAVSAFVPGIPIALGLAFGAAVSPPDPVASLSVARRANLPGRLVTLIEGEGLLNDATALTAYQVAVGAAVAGGELSLPLAAGRFLLAALGGLAIGVVLGWLRRLARPLLRDPLVANAVSLATPFAAYAAGESAHVSGVLAVVVVALIAGHDSPRLSSGAGRIQTTAVWRLVDFLLEGFVFLLIGEQLPAVIRGLAPYTAATIATAAGVAVGVALLARPAFLVFTNVTPRFLHARLGDHAHRGDRALSGREIAALSWSGARGIITLAIAFALPLRTSSGGALRGRDLLLFCAYLVVLATLVGQGLTFGSLLRALRLGADQSEAVRLRNEARRAAVDAALAQLDEEARADDVPELVVEDLRRQLQAQRRRYDARLQAIAAPEDGAPERSRDYQAALRVRHAVIEAQRQELLAWRDAGRLSDKLLRVLEAELDHEERILPERR